MVLISNAISYNEILNNNIAKALHSDRNMFSYYPAARIIFSWKMWVAGKHLNLVSKKRSCFFQTEKAPNCGGIHFPSSL